MSELLKQFYAIHNEWKEQALLTDDEEEEMRLDDIRHSKQEILLKQMGNEDIQYIIDNYAGIAQAKIYYSKFMK